MRTELRSATEADLVALSDLALRSKGYWGYDEAFLAACKDELTITADRLDTESMIVADAGGVAVGYFALVMRPPGAELTDLFVDPASIGTGVGRQLWDEMVNRAKHGGAAWVDIEADPHAADWYQRRGATQIGMVASGSIPGRQLPLLRLALR